METYKRLFNLGEDFTIDGEIMERALESFEGAALKFSYDAIADAKQRENYNRGVARVKAEMLAEVKAGHVSVKEAAEHCYEMRNKIMAITRSLTSKQGTAIAQRKKKVSPSLEKLIDSKSQEVFGRGFLKLTQSQRTAVHYGIVESSARPSAVFNVANKMLRVSGKVFIVVSATYAVLEVFEAENKTKEALRQGATIGGE